MSAIRCFVGHVFSRSQIDDLRDALRTAFATYGGVELYFADEYFATGQLLDRLREAIDSSQFCIFEISDSSRPNVFIELGYAMGRGKMSVLLVARGTVSPSDLQGLERIEYESMKDLTQTLKQRYLPQSQKWLAVWSKVGKRPMWVPLICESCAHSYPKIPTTLS